MYMPTSSHLVAKYNITHVPYRKGTIIKKSVSNMTINTQQKTEKPHRSRKIAIRQNRTETNDKVITPWYGRISRKPDQLTM